MVAYGQTGVRPRGKKKRRKTDPLLASRLAPKKILQRQIRRTFLGSHEPVRGCRARRAKRDFRVRVSSAGANHSRSRDGRGRDAGRLRGTFAVDDDVSAAHVRCRATAERVEARPR